MTMDNALQSDPLAAIDDIKQRLEAARERSRAETCPENTADVKALHSALGAALSDGADPCPGCGRAPHGIEQKRGEGRNILTEYEIGCLACQGFRVRTKTQRGAVLLWNAREFS
jgi:hypothetical protein